MNEKLVVVLAVAKVIGGVIAFYGGWKWLDAALVAKAASARNERIKTALQVADQVVIGAQKFFGTGKEQHDEAVTFMQKRLDSMGYGKYFNLQEVDAYVQSAYMKQKVAGVLPKDDKIVNAMPENRGEGLTTQEEK